MTFMIEFSAADIDATFGAMADDVEAAARPAAQAGAQVLYDEAKRNAMAIRKTGELERSIYQAFKDKASVGGRVEYQVSWNTKKAPFALNVEFGHLMRYAYYQDDQGRVRLRVRPGMEGKPKPTAGGRAKNRAALDAYYVTLPTPVHVPAQSFMRKAWASHRQKAAAAAVDELFRRLDKGGKA